jgi:hypothetical protein
MLQVSSLLPWLCADSFGPSFGLLADIGPTDSLIFKSPVYGSCKHTRVSLPNPLFSTVMRKGSKILAD